ncbi:MAG: hypothetical protein AAF586_00930 [Planctomycetota bacterium]
MSIPTHPTVTHPSHPTRATRLTRKPATHRALAIARWAWRAVRAAWRWLPECRPIMAADRAESPEGVYRLMVNGRWVVIDRRRDS